MNSTKSLTMDDIRNRIVATEKVAHVTFYLVKDTLYEDDRYVIYSASEDRGLELMRDEESLYQGESIPCNNALTVLGIAIQHLEEILERKRKGPPTQKQVYFLFCEKIPIPIDLTWGQASDLIDERLSQIPKDKQAKRLERFNGFAEGDRVSYFSSWDKETKLGHITKLYQAGKNKYIRIKFDDSSTLRTESFDNLQKINEETTP